MKHIYTFFFLLLVSSVYIHGQSIDSTELHSIPNPARVAGRTQGLPYPIIFIHGLAGSDDSWYEFAYYLRENHGFTAHTLVYVNEKGIPTGGGRAGEGSRLSFNLNYDNNIYSSDARYDYADLVDESKLGNNDIYIINFNTGNQSNQSAVHKQGLAVRDAIRHVRNVTGADKVILMGHSMGGLAARDYLQNPWKWQADGQHHIAKLVTVGTPHGGSNATMSILSSFDKIDELSEAVRDLRYSYYNGNGGTFLYGGYENKDIVKGAFLNYFHNVDINCNGSVGDYVEGLNKKPTIRTDLAFSTVIGNGINTTPANVLGDGVVESGRANLKNYYDITQDAFYAYNTSGIPTFSIHETLCSKTYFYQNLQALDEPGTNYLAYEIKPGNTYKGFLSPQPNTSNQDIDRYKIYVNEKGYFTIGTSSIASPVIGVTCRLVDDSGTQYGSQYSGNGSGINYVANVPRAGWYYLVFEANTFTNTFYKYSYSIGFQAVLDKPIISVVGPNTVCNGQAVTLQGPSGYPYYRWYKDGTRVQEGDKLSYQATSSGIYSLVVARNFVESPVSDGVTVTINTTPAKPVITKEERPDEVVLTASSEGVTYVWLSGGSVIAGVTERTYKPDREGTYSVRVSNGQCVSSSDPVTVRVDKPVITVTGSTTICSGDNGPTGYGTYIWQVGGASVGGNKSELVTMISGIYTLTVKRGQLAGAVSEPVKVAVKSTPPTPTLTLTSAGLQSSSSENNQWLLNGQPLAGEIQPVLSQIGAGNYAVRVTVNGCSATSSFFVVTGIDDPVTANMRVYPNPVSDMMFIESDQAIRQVDIVTVTGSEVLTKRLSGRGQKVVTVSVQELSVGVYLVRVRSDGDRVQNFKIIVQ